MRNLICIATLTLLSIPEVHSQELLSSNVRTVVRFVAAFNSHDSEAMAEFVSEDVAWLNINGNDLAVAVAGKDELVTSMNAYFQSCPTCQSELAEAISTPGRVSAIEIATWQVESGSKSQRSISVYEFSGDVIQRVYYFNSEE